MVRWWLLYHNYYSLITPERKEQVLCRVRSLIYLSGSLWSGDIVVVALSEHSLITPERKGEKQEIEVEHSGVASELTVYDSLVS